jgi:preprotein translocase subunit SecA
MFTAMMEGIKEEAVGFLFNLEVQVQEQPTVTVDPSQAVPLPSSDSNVEVKAKGLGGNGRPRNLQYTAPAIDGEAGAAGSPSLQREQEPQQSAPALGLGGNVRPAVAPNPAHTAAAHQSTTAQATASNGPSRNAPCYCGSGKKYKRCHGAPGAA